MKKKDNTAVDVNQVARKPIQRNLSVWEYSIFSEMSKLATVSHDFVQLFDNITKILLKVPCVASALILMYDEDVERFVTRSVGGAGEKFGNKLSMSLSDPILEDLTAMRGPLIIADVQKIPYSSSMSLAKTEGFGSAVLLKLMAKEKIQGIICVFSKPPNEFIEEEILILGVLAGQASVAIENANLYEAARKKQQLVEQLLGKVIYAQEEERKRISTEIHDTIAQSLVGILAKVQNCHTLMGQNKPEAHKEMEDLIKVVGDSLREVRQIIFELRPSTLDDLGLVPSIENYIKRFGKENNIQIDLTVNDRERRLPEVIETAVYRVLQEAMLNIKKHAGATEVKVLLNYDANQFTILVSDNGKGLDWDLVTEKLVSGGSQGITGMRERISLLGGQFKIISEKGIGTTVEAVITLPRNL